ncbi:hypothetical protein F5882DRAFT_385828 [Hyaloscypha sp. PMI_1271]|nr:hypothetical protein F5882DRAFT_385828 [Hyaloscypha sp. PMI_1271]
MLEALQIRFSITVVVNSNDYFKPENIRTQLFTNVHLRESQNPRISLTTSDKGYYPGREDMEFMESVEGVHDQIAQLNPKFDLEDVEVSKSDHLEKRGTSRWPPNCNVGRVSGQTAVQPTESIVRLGIDYLNIDDSSCSTPPGCSRLFCAGNSAIFLCNDH